MEENNYVKIIYWLRENKTDEVAGKTVRVLHDSWCSIWNQQTCNCQPEIYHEEKLISYPEKILTES